MIENIPILGSGLGFRHEISEDIFGHSDHIDFVEIIAEGYCRNSASYRRLRDLREKFTVIPHGVSLSIGSPMLDRCHLDRIKTVCDVIDPPYYSDHLCVTKIPGVSTGHLTPMWFSEETLCNTINNIKIIQDYLERPLVLENITYYFNIGSADYSQTAFFQELVAETQCGLLLDVANVIANSHNHNYDPLAFIDALPLDNLVQVHIAGGFTTQDGVIIDSHNTAVSEESWRLLEYVSAKAKIKAILLEHDSNFPKDFSMLTNQLLRARCLLQSQPLAA